MNRILFRINLYPISAINISDGILKYIQIRNI